MAVSYQLVIDCTSPELLAHFWAEALHYVITLPPSGFDSWDDFYRSIGVSEVELGTGPDRIEDPNGEGPRWPVGRTAAMSDKPVSGTLPREQWVGRARSWQVSRFFLSPR
jgi:hypothetical protein